MMNTTQAAFLSITSTFVTNHRKDDDEEEEEEEDNLSLTTILTPQLIIALIALILNVGVIIKFWKVKKRRICEYVLFSLAFADALYCFFTLIGVLLLYLEDKYELEGETIASFNNQLIWFSIYASIFHVLTISFDRFIAMNLPFKYRVLSHEAPIKRFLLLLWILTAVLQASVAIYQYKDGIENAHELDLKVQKIAGGIIFTTNIVLCIAYGMIIFRIIQMTRESRNLLKDSKTEVRACVVAVVNALGFVAFTFPIALFPYLTIENGEEGYLVVLCLLLCNSMFNPIVYFWRGYITDHLKSDVNSDGREALTTKSRTESVTLSAYHGTNKL